jgi:mannose-1-phosphate guanylyltransferase/mannose-6-phosphate isomerase
VARGGLYPLILCGGAGARLWPASREDRAKPFLRLFGERTLFQETALRAAQVEGAAAATVVAGAAHADLIRSQLAEAGLAGRLVIEPQPRETAAALIAGALAIAQADPGALVLALASDHHVPDAAAFAAAVGGAAAAARQGRIVTLGAKPTSPSSAFGYVQPGEALDGAAPALGVRAFVEKPDALRAAILVAEGWLWNSGVFLFAAATLIAEAERLAPEILAAARAALAEAGEDGAGGLRLGPAFAAAPKVAFDVAVMERTDRAAVLPVDYAWSDVGAWNAVWAAAARDGDGNALFGDIAAHGVTGSLIHAEDGAQVVALGLQNIAIVAVGGRVLVADLARSPELKPYVEALRARSDQEAADQK